ncbi:MerR family transcriptional regulator [Nocardia jejuensis]|uniref:MerR family transcriptional regulator n=1 Tax=Nocardia jejuensis TaxID=328049 RepID=UPI0008325D44|nr:MerR family transcriptional regulator [Nocardia jejuensis]
MTGVHEQEAYPVRVVAEELGMPVATLRSWSQRYGIGPQRHRSGRHRLYSRADIDVAARMLALVRAGASPASAARAVNPVSVVPEPGHGIDALLDAAFHLDSPRVLDLLESQLRRHGVVDTWDGLCRPAFAQIVTRQGQGEACTDVEHLLSWAVINALHRITPAPDRVARGAVILACAPGEFHTLPIEILRAALAEKGVHADMLGASLPAAALRAALERRSRRSTAVVWAQSPETADPGLLAVVGAESVRPAGPGWSDAGLPSGTRVLRTLPDALSELRSPGP